MERFFGRHWISTARGERGYSGFSMVYPSKNRVKLAYERHIPELEGGSIEFQDLFLAFRELSGIPLGQDDDEAAFSGAEEEIIVPQSI